MTHQFRKIEGEIGALDEMTRRTMLSVVVFADEVCTLSTDPDLAPHLDALAAALETTDDTVRALVATRVETAHMRSGVAHVVDNWSEEQDALDLFNQHMAAQPAVDPLNEAEYARFADVVVDKFADTAQVPFAVAHIGRTEGAATGAGAPRAAAKAKGKGKRKRGAGADDDDGDDDADVVVAQHQRPFLCPLTQMPMEKPVRSTECGHHYDQPAIFAAIAATKNRWVKCPAGTCQAKVTLAKLSNVDRVLAGEIRARTQSTQTNREQNAVAL